MVTLMPGSTDPNFDFDSVGWGDYSHVPAWNPELAAAFGGADFDPKIRRDQAKDRKLWAQYDLSKYNPKKPWLYDKSLWVQSQDRPSLFAIRQDLWYRKDSPLRKMPHCKKCHPEGAPYDRRLWRACEHGYYIKLDEVEEHRKKILTAGGFYIVVGTIGMVMAGWTFLAFFIAFIACCILFGRIAFYGWWENKTFYRYPELQQTGQYVKYKLRQRRKLNKYSPPTTPTTRSYWDT